MRSIILLLLAFLGFVSAASAQSASLGEGDGTSSIILNPSESQLSVTTKDPSLKLNYEAMSGFGMQLIVNTKGGFATLAEGSVPYLKATGAVSYIQRIPTANFSIWSYCYGALGAGAEHISLFYPSTNYLSDTTKPEYFAKLGYNYITVDPFGLGTTMILGASGTLFLGSNSDTLSAEQVQTVTSYPGPDSGSRREVRSSEQTAYEGGFRLATTKLISLDFYWITNAAVAGRQIGISLFSRTRLGDATDLGLGLYAHSPGAPAIVQVGIAFVLQDSFNIHRSTDPVSKRASISLIGGVPI